jgi:hypothetical protein
MDNFHSLPTIFLLSSNPLFYPPKRILNLFSLFRSAILSKSTREKREKMKKTPKKPQKTSLIKKALITLGLITAPILSSATTSQPKTKSATKAKVTAKAKINTADTHNLDSTLLNDPDLFLRHQTDNKALLEALEPQNDSAEIRILALKNDSLTDKNINESQRLKLDKSLNSKINTLIKHHSFETDSVALDSAWNRLCSLEEKMLQFIAHFEDLKVRAYRVHPKDPWTYGYGFTYNERGKPVKPGDRIYSVKHLLLVWSQIVRGGHTERPKDIKQLNQCLFGELCQILPINQMTDEEIIANASFRYNGRPTFLKEKDGKSNYATLMYRYVITKDKEDLDTLISLHEKYCHSAGKVLGGLQKRRAVEELGLSNQVRLVLSQEERDSLPEDLRDKALVLKDLTVGASHDLALSVIKDPEEYLNKVTEVKGDTMEVQLQKKLQSIQYVQKPKQKPKAPTKTNQPTSLRVRRGTRGK